MQKLTIEYANRAEAAVAATAFNASPGSGVSARVAGCSVILTMHSRLVSLSRLLNAVLGSGRELLYSLGWTAGKRAA